MQSQSLIQVRVDRPLKDEVADIFTSLGIDTSTAIRIFLQRCRAVRGIPFPLMTAQQVPEVPKIRIGLAKGMWKFPDNWETEDKAMDKEIEADFYADSL